MTSVTLAAVSNFKVQSGAVSTSSGGGGGGSTGWIAQTGNKVRTRSGTRYVIRVKCDNGEYKDIGGDYYDLFYLNHTYRSFGHNNTENDGANSEEAMWSGTRYYYNNVAVNNKSDMVMNGLYRLQNGGKVFDTYASSIRTYTKSAQNSKGETVDQARHVLTWLLNAKREK